MSVESVSDAAPLRTSSPAVRRAGAKYDGLIAKAKNVSAEKTIVVHPCDETSLRGPIEAAEAGIIVPILVGPATKITAIAHEHKLDISRFEIVDVPKKRSRSQRRSSSQNRRSNLGVEKV
jgi:phosphate acetyltransferase